jgi:hypothetical protein
MVNKRSRVWQGHESRYETFFVHSMLRSIIERERTQQYLHESVLFDISSIEVIISLSNSGQCYFLTFDQWLNVAQQRRVPKFHDESMPSVTRA